MVSITASSIVSDMVDSFQRLKMDINTDHFAWEKSDIVRVLHEFVLTRECWQYAQNQAPAFEITFGVTGGRRGRDRRRVPEELNMHFHYSWNPPTIGFSDLQNVVVESADFVLKPSASSSRPFSEFRYLEIEYCIGPKSAWLR